MRKMPELRIRAFFAAAARDAVTNKNQKSNLTNRKSNLYEAVSRIVKQMQSNRKRDTSPHLQIDHHRRRRAKIKGAAGRRPRRRCVAEPEARPRRSRGLAEGAAEHRWRRGRWEYLINVQKRCREITCMSRDVTCMSTDVTCMSTDVACVSSRAPPPRSKPLLCENHQKSVKSA